MVVLYPWEHPVEFAFMLAIFLASLLVLNFLVFKPTLKILMEREKQLAGMEKEAKYFEELYENKLTKYNDLMDEARKLAKLAREDILKHARQEVDEIMAEARDLADKKVSEAKNLIHKEYLKARSDVNEISKTLAGQIVGKITEKKVA